MNEKIEQFYEFDGFRLDLENRSLWRHDQPVAISPKCLDILILLVRRNGEIVSRDDLLSSVWKDTFVDEGNISYTISLLRKTLGDRTLIQTVSRRGYRFLGNVRDRTQNGGSSVPDLAFKAESVPESPKRTAFLVFAAVCIIGLVVVTGLVLWPGGTNLIAAPDPVQSKSSEAMQAYARGRMIFDDRDAKNRDEKAGDEFQKAITLDPSFAPAYAGLGEVYVRRGISESHGEGLESLAKARAALNKAYELDQNLAEAYSLAGWIKLKVEWDFAGAEKELSRANQLQPDDARILYRLSQVFAPLGRHDEALAAIRRASELDPISETISVAQFPVLESRGEIDEGLRLAERLHRDNKENRQILRAYGTFLFHKGEFYRVIELGKASIEPKGAFAWHSLLASSYHRISQIENRDDSLEKLEALAETDTKALYSLAMNYTEMERIDDALRALEECFRGREERMLWLKVEPRFARLRSDKRFHEILAKIGLS